MALDKFINSIRSKVAKKYDLKTNAEIDAFFIGMEESAKDNQEALERRDKMLRDTVAELAEARRLLKLAVEDFAKLDRVNTKVRNCMMPDMDCADCPLNWDSVDDSVEPCHNWRYTNEALKLIES